MTDREKFKLAISEIKNIKKYDFEKMVLEAAHFVKTGEYPGEGSETHKFMVSAGVENDGQH